MGHPNTVTVSAGDTIGASPLISANYLDEPTITAMNLIGLEFNSVGNHEFDKGGDELRRMQGGGCVKFTRRQPCAVEPFAGARFRYLSANVFGSDGQTFFPATGIKTFGNGPGAITIGFIGMTLKETGNLVTPSGVQGLAFAEEAKTANALVPSLRAQGAEAIVLLIHQGGKTKAFTTGNDCNGLDGRSCRFSPSSTQQLRQSFQATPIGPMFARTERAAPAMEGCSPAPARTAISSPTFAWTSTPSPTSSSRSPLPIQSSAAASVGRRRR